MKRKSIVLFAILVLAMTACKKEINNLEPEFRSSISGKEDPTFIDTTADVALQYLENYLNYMSADLTVEKDNIIFTSAWVNITHDGIHENEEVVYLDEEYQDHFYTFMLDSIGAMFSTVSSVGDYDEYGVRFVDLDSITINGTSSIDVYMTIAIAVTGNGVNCNTYDYWWYNTNGGGCNTNTATTSGAPEQMMMRLNGNCEYVAQYISVNEWFSNIQSIYTYAPGGTNPNDPNPGDGVIDGHLFQDINRGCLSSAEMEFHTNIGSPYIGNTLKPIGKVILSYKIEDFWIAAGNSVYWHNQTTTYGKYNNGYPTY